MLDFHTCLTSSCVLYRTLSSFTLLVYSPRFIFSGAAARFQVASAANDAELLYIEADASSESMDEMERQRDDRRILPPPETNGT